MADSTITNKVWNIAGVLMDGGVSNSDYLEQITFLLFLKMIVTKTRKQTNFFAISTTFRCPKDIVGTCSKANRAKDFAIIIKKCSPHSPGKAECSARYTATLKTRYKRRYTCARLST